MLTRPGFYAGLAIFGLGLFSFLQPGGLGWFLWTLLSVAMHHN